MSVLWPCAAVVMRSSITSALQPFAARASFTSARTACSGVFPCCGASAGGCGASGGVAVVVGACDEEEEVGLAVVDDVVGAEEDDDAKIGRASCSGRASQSDTREGG